MLERLVEQRRAINVYFEENDSDIEMLSNADYKFIANLIKLLEPLEIATNELSGDKYSSISLVVPILTQLHVELKEMRPDDLHIKQVRDKLYNSIKTRFASIEKNKYCRNATLLDSRLKDTCFILEENKNEAKLNYKRLFKTHKIFQIKLISNQILK